MNLKKSQLWVGEFEDGEQVVFAPGEQKPDETEWVHLWSSESRRIERYAKDIVKKSIRKVTDKAKMEAALSDYFACRVDEKKKAEANAARNHRQRIERLGLVYAGAKSSERSLRITGCWECKGELDNRIDLECNACGWILCQCGACGCGKKS